jgi:hypothetical protein
LSSFSVQEDEKENEKETEKETKRRTLNDTNLACTTRGRLCTGQRRLMVSLTGAAKIKRLNEWSKSN